MNLPTLYKLTSTGAIQTWEIYTDRSPSGEGCIITLYGQQGGKIQKAEEWICEGKNLGKINETTPLQQAELEAKAQWEKKLKNKGYVQNLEDAEAGKRDERVVGGIDPMLAHSYDKRGHDIRWPAFVQPKLDGHRCVAVLQGGVCTLWSRQRKKITGVPHINRAIEAMYAVDIILDGELYNHDYRDNFEELTSFIRQVTPKPGHEVVQYWIYDVISDDTTDTFQERADLLNFDVKDAIEDSGQNNVLIVLPTEEVENKDEMIAVFGAYIENGFEGLMVRNAAGKYVGKRSKDLQKVKLMQDAEYEVVAIEQGKGKMAGKAMFVCLIPCEMCQGRGHWPALHTLTPCPECKGTRGKTFRVKMVGKLDDLCQYWENPTPWLNKMLTVQFQKFSAEGVPIFPVALRFREDV